jgi:hypothetical protein
MNLEQMRVLAWYYLKGAVAMRVLAPLNERLRPGLARARTKQWAALREAIAGHDDWLVVGNGPSLRIEDLEALSHIPAIASNKINLLFDRTAWRPRLFTIGDSLLMHKLPAEHYEDFAQVLLPDLYAGMCRAARPLHWRFLSDDAAERMYVHGDTPVTPGNGFFVGSTVTCANIQLAIWAGAKRVHLIGVDHSYKREQALTGRRASHDGGGSDHFDPNYRKPGEIVGVASIDKMERSYHNLRLIAEKRGVEVINITRTSMLDIFKRGTVEEVIAATKGEEQG